MKTEKINTTSAGSKPARKDDKHIKAFSKDHKKITETVNLLIQEFTKKAALKGVPVRAKGTLRNLPRQQDAVACLLSGLEPGMEGMSVENLAYWYIEDMFKKAGAV